MKKYLFSLLRFATRFSGILSFLILFNVQFANAGTISGPSSFCLSSSSYTTTYTASGFTGATNYIWSVPSYATILSGQNTPTISVRFSSSATTGGAIMVSTNQGSSGLGLTVYRKAGAAGTISGPASVCAGQANVLYSVPNISNATQYSWVMPAGASIASQTGSSVRINFSTSFTGGVVRVYGIAGPCGPGESSTKTISKVTPPGSTGAINGTSTVSPGATNVSYSVAAISGATGYDWTVPSGATIVSGLNTRSIKVNFATSFTSGNIVVKGLIGGCSGPSSAPLNVTRSSLPGPAGSISGSRSPCVGATDVLVTYSINPVLNQDPKGYVWSLGPGMIPLGNPSLGGDPRTNVMQVKLLASSSMTTTSISVYNKNGYGSGASSTATIAPYRPAGLPTAISGPSTVCPGDTDVIYSVSPIENASPHVWSLPEGVSYQTGWNTSSITVNFSETFTGGQIKVYGVSGPCGAGPSSIIDVAIPIVPGTPGSITGSSLVCPGIAGEVYSIPALANATSYEWSVPPGATITQGHNTNSITVSYSSSTTSGDIRVLGKNCIGNGPTVSKAITMKPQPEAAETIIGESLICPGEKGIVYSIPPIANATGYVWTVPSGVIIKSGQNTSKITVDFLSTTVGGNIVVKGTGCGTDGPSSLLSIATSANVGANKVSHSVDLATGIMSAGIPIFNVHDGDVQVPAVLSYSATGVRVTDDDGWVGHNWNLSVQSYKITREMRGLPDDLSTTSDNRKGWLYGTKRTAIKNFTINTDNNPATCSDEVVNYTFLNGIGINEDTEPDVFYVNAPGLSFQFYFDENRQPQALPYQDVVITPSTASGPFTSTTTTGLLSSFSVLDSRGYKYIFAETEFITESLQEANEFYLVRKSKMHLVPFTYNTSWRLTRIESPVYGAVDFTYKTVIQGNNALYPDWYKRSNQYKYRFGNVINNSGGAEGVFVYDRNSTLKILQTISSPTMEAEFISAPKYEGTTMERLSAIEIYDKREGVSKLTKTISLLYSHTNHRAFLTNILESIQCQIQEHKFEYYTEQIPAYDSKDKDDWGFSTAVEAGSLKRIIHPFRGYDVFFYESHEYVEDNETYKGGGIRLRKSITYDGVSSDNDVIKVYEYKNADGESSGKLQGRDQYEFSVVRVDGLAPPFDHFVAPRYKELSLLSGTFDNFFNLKSEEALSHYSMLNGSVVAYERVTVKQKEMGHSIYEFDLPASYGEESANANEWQASKINIARPAAGAYGCYELANITRGINAYPFPPNPSYEFAKGLLQKITDYSESGNKVREVSYDYQRVYGNGSSIQKIYGLALEELPTYYYTGSSYVDSKMFLYSKYEIFTNVKTEISDKVEIIYNSTDLSKYTEVSTSYFFDSPNHRELSRIVNQKSDGSQVINRIKYARDFDMTNPTGTSAIALKNLNTTHRTTVVESIMSEKIGATEKYISANLTTFQTLSGKVYPDKQLSFASPDGDINFEPSTITGNSTFDYDQNNYSTIKSFSGIDNFGNLTVQTNKDRIVSSVVYGYNGTLPILNISYAQPSEVIFSDFETATPVQFITSWGLPTYVSGRNNSKGINLPSGSNSNNYLTGTVSYDNSPYFILSFWTKANAAGDLSIVVGTGVTNTYTFPFDASTDWRYYSVRVPVGDIIGSSDSFYVRIWSNVGTPLDDIAFYPEQAEFVASTYEMPNGKTSETDSRGISYFYEYDAWGRIKVVYDQNKNIIKKYDYQVRP